MSQLQYKLVDCEFKAVEDDGSFALYAAVFSNEDRQGDIIAPGAFRNLAEFTRDGFGLVNHVARALPVAWIESAVQDDKGLKVTGRFHSTPDAQAVRTVTRERLAAGRRVLCSIGYTVKDAAMEVRDGERVRIIRSLNVYEFSFVNLPANPEAEVVAAKSAESPGEPMNEPENDSGGILQALKELLGLSKKAVSSGKMSRSGMTRLKSFAEAMHEHGEKSVEHCKAMNEHAKAAKCMAKEMKSFLKDFDPDGSADDDDSGPTDRGDVEHDEEGDEEVRPPKKPKKGRKEGDTDDAGPPKGGLTQEQKDLRAYRRDLQSRSVAGRSMQACP